MMYSTIARQGFITTLFLPSIFLPSTWYDKMSPPFYEDPQGDIILRTSDAVDLRACKAILSRASPFFKDLFQLPQPAQSEASSPSDDFHDGIPVLSMTEDAITISTVLQICYPTPSPVLNDLSLVKKLLEAGRKYQLTIISSLGEEALKEGKFLEKDPIEIYAICCRYGLIDGARTAARWSLRLPSTIFYNAYSTELDHISATAYLRLLQYRQSCQVAAQEPVKYWSVWTLDLMMGNRIWKDGCVNNTSIASCCIGVKKVENGVEYWVKRWFSVYLDQLLVDLGDRPWSGIVKTESMFQALLRELGVCNCGRIALDDIEWFTTTLKDKIDRGIRKVVLDTSHIIAASAAEL